MSKFEDTRIVTFKEDYAVPRVDKNGDPTDQKIVYYKKGSRHAIHFKVVDKLKSKGAKMDIELFDRKGFLEKEKTKKLKSEKASFTIERRWSSTPPIF